MTSALLGKSGANKTGDQELLTSKIKSNGGEDEARAFLTFASGGCDESSTEQGLCQRRRRVTGGQLGALSVLLLVLVGASLAITITCLELYHQREVAHLQSSLAALRRDVDTLKHRVQEQDLFNELRAFEEAVYGEEALEENQYDEDEDEEEEDQNGDDVDYYTDEEEEKGGEDEPADERRRGRFIENYEKILRSHGALHKSERSKREILSGSDSAVPVLSESYNKTPSNSEGLRLYESLVAGGGKGEPQEATENPIKDYHRKSSVWPEKHARKHHHEGPRLRELPHPYHRRRSASSTTQTPAPIISRKSRVMETDTDSSRRQASTNINRIRFHSAPRLSTVTPPPLPSDGEVVVRVYQEQREGAQPELRSSYPGVKRVRNIKKKVPVKKTLANQEIDELQPTHPSARRRLLPAAHFGGDTSKYSLEHPHYEGNGRLRHPEGLFTDWTASSWVNELGMQRHFNLTRGILEVLDSGLYMVYAQIHYLDEHDTNGYGVYVNGAPFLHCTVMAHDESNRFVLKSNSCYTSGVLYLEAGDKLTIRDASSMRYSIFEPTKSFFGFIKLGRAKIRDHKK
ncbi:protein eiger [Anabrus simplex]|uniref:protein eiger n=1 Tax=Anabrus simplex TaxID=316456 RepID=UPI0035A27DEC